jgi:nucleoside-diphosphate-sugar epimerase
VTGAMGRVAAPLIPALAERYDVRLVDRAGGDGDGAGAPLVVGELTDPEILERALDGVDAVVHLAGNPNPDARWHELEEPNVEAFVALLRAARGHGVRRVIFASSVHAMGFYEGSRRWPIDPAWPPAPCCAYGATKAFDEALARVYAYQSGMSLIGLRLGLCAPEASPAEAVAGWLGSEDLRRIVLGALAADVRFGVYNAVSWPSRRRWSIDTAMRDLGYEPDRDDGAGEGDGESADGHLCTCGPGHEPA